MFLITNYKTVSSIILYRIGPLSMWLNINKGGLTKLMKNSTQNSQFQFVNKKENYEFERFGVLKIVYSLNSIHIVPILKTGEFVVFLILEVSPPEAPKDSLSK